MTDEQIIQSGQTVANMALESMSDVIQAFIAALSDKSTKDQRDVLSAFSDYIKIGGELFTTTCDMGSFELFEKLAKEKDLTYFAVINHEDNNICIITKDKDTSMVAEISQEMAREGRGIMKNPQLPVTAYTRRIGDAIMYVNIESYDQVEKAKSKVAELGAHFAVAKKNDGSYMVLTDKEDIEKLKQAEAIPRTAMPKIFGHQSDLHDVFKLIKDKRRREEEEREMEKQQKKNRGRE